MKLVYKIHKWLAVVAALATLGWFVSGALMVIPARWRTLSPGVDVARASSAGTSAPRFEEAQVPIAQAIAGVRSRIGEADRVTAITLRQVRGRLVYEIATVAHGSQLIDAVGGGPFFVSREEAIEMVSRALGAKPESIAVTVQADRSSDYRGAFPAYRLALADWKQTVFYVTVATGEVRMSDRLSRASAWIIAWHGFDGLRPLIGPPAVRMVLVAISIVGVLMSLAGVVILFEQWRRWQRRRQAY